MIGIFDLSDNFLKNYFKDVDKYMLIIDGTNAMFYDVDQNYEKVATISIWKFLSSLLQFAKITHYDFVE